MGFGKVRIEEIQSEISFSKLKPRPIRVCGFLYEAVQEDVKYLQGVIL